MTYDATTDPANPVWVNSNPATTLMEEANTFNINRTSATLVRVTDSNGVDFLAFDVPAGTFAISPRNQVSVLYSGNIDETFTLSTSNVQGTPVYNVESGPGTISGNTLTVTFADDGSQIPNAGGLATVATVSVSATVNGEPISGSPISVTVQLDDRRGININGASTFDRAGSADYTFTANIVSFFQPVANNFVANLVNDSQHPLGSNSFTDTVTISRSLFEFGQTNTVNISSSDTREPHTGTSPILTASDAHVVNVYRAFFFYQSGNVPASGADFDSGAASPDEFSALLPNGQNRTLSATTTGDWVLAYPSDITTSFTYTTQASFGSTPRIEPAVMRNGVEYSVFVFPAVDAGTTYTIREA